MVFEKMSSGSQGPTTPSVFPLKMTNPKRLEGRRQGEKGIRAALATFLVFVFHGPKTFGGDELMTLSKRKENA